MSLKQVEFAIREVAVSIQYLLDVVENDPYTYEAIPYGLHRSLTDLMKEIADVDWEVLGR